CCLIYDLRSRLCRTSVLEPAGAFDVLVQCCRWLLVSDLVLHRNLLYQAQAGPRSHRNSSPRIPLDSLRRASWPAAHRLAHALRPSARAQLVAVAVIAGGLTIVSLLMP